MPSGDDLAITCASKLAQFCECLVEDRFAILVATTLFHVGEVRFVRLNLRSGWRVRSIPSVAKVGVVSWPFSQ